MKKVICCVSLMLSVSAFADDLVEFQTGQTATAAEVNANFSELEDRIDDASQPSGVAVLSSRLVKVFTGPNCNDSVNAEFVVAECAAGETVAGGSAICNITLNADEEFVSVDLDNTNFGILWGVIQSEDTVTGFCRSDDEWSPSLCGPAMTVVANCISLDSNSVSPQSAARRVLSISNGEEVDDVREGYNRLVELSLQKSLRDSQSTED